MHPAADPTLPAEVSAALRDPRRRVGRHVLLDELGRGGMGVVHRGYDTGLRRPVAIKMVLGNADEQALRRFGREARAAARLGHPAIVAVHEVGEHEGRPFIVMDLIEGEPLDACLARGPLAPREAAALAASIASALDHAHREGVIHRDIKPQNILLDRGFLPHLGDFGLARETQAGGITRTGAFLGTAGYAPPEQVRGDPGAMGPASDVFALGAVLYHALAGRGPFEAESGLNVLMATLRFEPPPPSSLRPGVPPDLDTITLRCLQKDAGRRYPSAAALAEDLERFGRGDPILARPPSRIERVSLWARRHRRRLTVVLTAAGVLLGAGAAGAVVLGAVRVRAKRTARAEMAALARSESAAAWEAFVAARADAGARDAHLATGLTALQTAGRLHDLAPEDGDAARGVFRAAIGLGEVALAAGQWSLATSAFEEALAAGVDDARARAAVQSVEAARNARDEERRRAVGGVLARAFAGELTTRAGAYDDALFTVLRYPDARTEALLVRALDELTGKLRAATREVYLAAAEPDADEARAGARPIEGLAAAVDRLLARAPAETLPPELEERLARAARRAEMREARAWPIDKRSQAPGFEALLATAQEAAVGRGGLVAARLCSEALGRFGSAAAVEALERLLGLLAAEEEAVPPAIALCRLGGPRAGAALDAARARFGEAGPFWRQVAPFRDRLDLRVPAAGDDPAGWLARGRAHRERGEAAAAIAALGRAIVLDASLAEAWLERGRARAAAGDARGALNDIDRFLRLAPDDPRADAARSELAALRQGEPR